MILAGMSPLRRGWTRSSNSSYPLGIPMFRLEKPERRQGCEALFGLHRVVAGTHVPASVRAQPTGTESKPTIVYAQGTQGRSGQA